MSLKLNGSTSGYVEIDAPAVAGSTSITLPATTGGEFVVTDSAGDLNVDNGTLFVDASTNRVGIGTASPNQKLEVDGNIRILNANNLQLANTGDVQFLNAAGTSYSTGIIGSSDNMILYTADTERIRITSTGLHRHHSSEGVFRVNSSQGAGTTYELFWGGYGGSSTTSEGTNSIKIYTNGNVQNTNNSYGPLSDVKLKENIVDASSQWTDVKALRVVNFNFKPETGYETHKQIGFIAQEVEQVSPGLVYDTPDRDEDGNELGTVTKVLQTSVLYTKAVKALQEAMERIETLEAINASFEARLTALEGGQP